MKRPHIRKPWERHRSITSLEGQESKTDFSFGNDTDVNRIVARFARTGQMPEPTREATYADVTALQGDLTDIMEKGKLAQEALKVLNAEKQKAEGEELDRLKAAAKELEELRSSTNQPGAEGDPAKPCAERVAVGYI